MDKPRYPNPRGVIRTAATVIFASVIALATTAEAQVAPIEIKCTANAVREPFTADCGIYFWKGFDSARATYTKTDPNTGEVLGTESFEIVDTSRGRAILQRFAAKTIADSYLLTVEATGTDANSSTSSYTETIAVGLPYTTYLPNLISDSQE
jgi:hypothetical protein